MIYGLPGLVTSRESGCTTRPKVFKRTPSMERKGNFLKSNCSLLRNVAYYRLAADMFFYQMRNFGQKLIQGCPSTCIKCVVLDGMSVVALLRKFTQVLNGIIKGDKLTIEPLGVFPPVTHYFKQAAEDLPKEDGKEMLIKPPTQQELKGI